MWQHCAPSNTAELSKTIYGKAVFPEVKDNLTVEKLAGQESGLVVGSVASEFRIFAQRKAVYFVSTVSVHVSVNT